MALPTAYLTSTKNLEGMLNAIRGAQAPEKFTQKFLENLEFKSNPDRLIISVLKALSFLDDGGRPTKRYFAYLDQSQSGRVMAEGIREAYADLFRINVNAQGLSKQDVINKFKTLSEGKTGKSVLDKMAMTFTALVKYGDFSVVEKPNNEKPPAPANDKPPPPEGSSDLRLGGLIYNIHIVLPESRDSSVYDAIFKSLRDHLK